MQNARKMPDSRQKRCVAASRCTNFESVPGRHGKRRRGGKRMRGARYEVTACGNVVCCEDCEVVHAEECEVRVANVQCSTFTLVINVVDASWSHCNHDSDYLRALLRRRSQKKKEGTCAAAPPAPKALRVCILLALHSIAGLSCPALLFRTFTCNDMQVTAGRAQKRRALAAAAPAPFPPAAGRLPLCRSPHSPLERHAPPASYVSSPPTSCGLTAVALHFTCGAAQVTTGQAKKRRALPTAAPVPAAAALPAPVQVKASNPRSPLLLHSHCSFSAPAMGILISPSCTQPHLTCKQVKGRPRTGRSKRSAGPPAAAASKSVAKVTPPPAHPAYCRPCPCSQHTALMQGYLSELCKLPAGALHASREQQARPQAQRQSPRLPAQPLHQMTPGPPQPVCRVPHHKHRQQARVHWRHI